VSGLALLIEKKLMALFMRLCLFVYFVYFACLFCYNSRDSINLIITSTLIGGNDQSLFSPFTSSYPHMLLSISSL